MKCVCITRESGLHTRPQFVSTQVTRGAHAYPNNRPIGIQKAFEAFLSGQLWQSGETESHLE